MRSLCRKASTTFKKASRIAHHRPVTASSSIPAEGTKYREIKSNPVHQLLAAPNGGESVVRGVPGVVLRDVTIRPRPIAFSLLRSQRKSRTSASEESFINNRVVSDKTITAVSESKNSSLPVSLPVQSENRHGHGCCFRKGVPHSTDLDE